MVPAIFEGENGLDPDRLKNSELKSVLTSCLKGAAREALVEGFLKDDAYGYDPLGDLVLANDKEGMREEITELEVSDALGERVFQHVWKKYHWAEEDE